MYSNIAPLALLADLKSTNQGHSPLNFASERRICIYLSLGFLIHRSLTGEVLVIAFLTECHISFQDEAVKKQPLVSFKAWVFSWTALPIQPFIPSISILLMTTKYPLYAAVNRCSRGKASNGIPACSCHMSYLFLTQRVIYKVYLRALIKFYCYRVN